MNEILKQFEQGYLKHLNEGYEFDRKTVFEDIYVLALKNNELLSKLIERLDEISWDFDMACLQAYKSDPLKQESYMSNYPVFKENPRMKQGIFSYIKNVEDELNFVIQFDENSKLQSPEPAVTVHPEQLSKALKELKKYLSRKASLEDIFNLEPDASKAEKAKLFKKYLTDHFLLSEDYLDGLLFELYSKNPDLVGRQIDQYLNRLIQNDPYLIFLQKEEDLAGLTSSYRFSAGSGQLWVFDEHLQNFMERLKEVPPEKLKEWNITLETQKFIHSIITYFCAEEVNNKLKYFVKNIRKWL